MFYRSAYWIGGFFVVALVAASWETVDRTTALLTGFAVWIGCGVAVELAAWWLTRAARASYQERTMRPSDGRREVAMVDGAIVRPNTVDRRFGRLTSWEEARDRLYPNTPFAPFPRPLRGRVALVSCFLGRDGLDWSDAEIAEVHTFLWRAAAWVEREAARWHAPVNVALAHAYLAGTDAQPRRESELKLALLEHTSSLADPDETVAVVAGMRRGTEAALGQTLEELAARLARGLDADHVVWIVHSRSAGTSCCLDEQASGLEAMPVAVCYAQEEPRSGPLLGPPFADPVTFVHELLHVFGATDKYGVSTRRFGREMVGERDVMVLHVERLSQLRVDTLTAQEIGWAGKSDRPAAPESA